jgi:recyclin-1
MGVWNKLGKNKEGADAVNSQHFSRNSTSSFGVTEKNGSMANKTPVSTMRSLTALKDPLICLDNVAISRKHAKTQLLVIYKCLNPYYRDFVKNKAYDKLKIFEDFDTPEEQSKILRNLLKFNKIDTDEQSCSLTLDKINALLEIFENALLRELDIHYDLEDYEVARRFVQILIDLENQQTLIEFFLQKVIFNNEKNEIFNLDTFNPELYFAESEICHSSFDQLVSSLADLFNQQSAIIDLIFPESVPMMYKVCEELVANQFAELIMILIDFSKSKNLYLQAVPYIYGKMTNDFIELLHPSTNVGETYFQLVKELIDMLYESFAAEFMREEFSYFRESCSRNIRDWNESLSKREAETSESILRHVKVETKDDFLTSFKKVFITSKSSSNKMEDDEHNYSEIQAKAKILSENIKSLDKMLSPQLVLESLNEAKSSIHRLSRFQSFSIHSLKSDVSTTMQDIFINILDTISNEHLKPGFGKALTYLQTYNPNSLTYSESHNEAFSQPLVLFFELINVADLIIQMVDIFYKEEILKRHIVKHENSILNPSLQNKKKLEALVDKYVADGLNIGIEILVNEIDGVYKTCLSPQDYCPSNDVNNVIGQTDAAQKALKILEENIDLLTDSADKSIVEVFQQEIAERFFQIVVKTVKQSTISVPGATNLISDLNSYNDFFACHIKSNKRMIMPLFQALKNIGSMYLISGDDAHAIGKLVSDLSKFNGIFGQEEIYEFVQRREDWPLIKRHVEKIMYGFGLADCKFM